MLVIYSPKNYETKTFDISHFESMICSCCFHRNKDAGKWLLKLDFHKNGKMISANYNMVFKTIELNWINYRLKSLSSKSFHSIFGCK